jgi:hypothetical protein
MRRFRLPIAGLMLFPLPFAVGLAALREPSESWASALFSLAVLALLVSVLGTAARRGASRMAFLGFTLFGTSYLILAFGPWASVNPDGLRPPSLITRILLDRIRESQVGLAANWQVVSIELPMRSEGQQLAFSPASLTNDLASGGLYVNHLYVPYDVSRYKQIAHSMLILVAGTLGAIVGRIVAIREADSA